VVTYFGTPDNLTITGSLVLQYVPSQGHW